MESPDWLRTQLTTFTCPCCGRRYGDSRVSLLAERDGLFFVELDCGRCGSHTVAMVTVELDDAEASIADLTDFGRPRPLPSEQAALGGPPVSADDVLEMHEFLATFKGDVDDLFRIAARRRAGMEGR